MVQHNCYKIVKDPHTRFLSVFRMLREAVSELGIFSDKLEIEHELKFTQRLGKYVSSVRQAM